MWGNSKEGQVSMIKALNGGHVMEGVYFLVLWIGGALLHTLYDLKLKPYLKTFNDEAKDRPFS